MVAVLVIFTLFGLGALIALLRVDYIHKSKILTVDHEFKEFSSKVRELIRTWDDSNWDYDRYLMCEDSIEDYGNLPKSDLSNRERILKELKREFLKEFKAEHREKRLDQLLNQQ